MVQHGAPFPVAGPPDEAGHQGSNSRPPEALAMHVEEALEMHAADQPPAGPPLHTEPIRLASAGDGVNPLWMLVGGLALAALVAFFVLVRL